MMKKLGIFLMATLLSLTLAACEGNKQMIGAGAGGALGGLLGSQIGQGNGRTAAIIGGTLLGALAGGAVGKSMDDVDRMKARQALETAQTGHATAWKNPDNGNSYSLTPTRTYEANGRPCRDFVTKATVAGRHENIHGRACRSPDGSWRMIS